MIIFAITALILILIFALLFFKMQAGIEYLHSGKEQKLIVHLRILGIPIKIRIPLNKKKKAKKEVKKSDNKKQNKKKLTFSRFKKICSGIYSAYCESKNDIKNVLSDLRQKIEFKTVDFKVHFGLSDAAKTGIATGAAWTSSSCLVSVINQMFGIKKIDLNVTPDFNRECFNLYVKSILILRPVHIISIGLKALKIVNLFIERMDLE